MTYARTLVTMSALVVSSFISKSQSGEKRGNCAGFPYYVLTYKGRKKQILFYIVRPKSIGYSVYTKLNHQSFS